MKVLLTEKELKEKGKISKDFKVGLGNEIYLTDTRDKTQIEKYFHFLLIAKNTRGHEALRKLSSIAWYNSFEDRRMCRVPTLKKELAQIVAEYPNTLIATSACIGGETAYAFEKKDWPRLNAFMDYCLKLFGDDFYLEMAPAEYPDQIRYNFFLNSQEKRISNSPLAQMLTMLQKMIDICIKVSSILKMVLVKQMTFMPIPT